MDAATIVTNLDRTIAGKLKLREAFVERSKDVNYSMTDRLVFVGVAEMLVVNIDELIKIRLDVAQLEL